MTGTSPSRQRALWLFAALILLLRAAIPAGWMPQADAGGIRIALCSGSGPIELTLEPDGTYHRDAPAQPASHDPCPFGLASAQPLDLPSAVALEPPSYAAGPEPASQARTAPNPRPHRALRPPVRGPPLFA